MPVEAVRSTVSPPKPLGENLITEWGLDSSIAHLNHGCFGARPRVVMKAQTAYRDAYEARTVEWLDRRRSELINRARESLARFVGAEPQNLGFVTNATGAINAVLRSLQFHPGDHLLTTNHVYNGVRMTMRHLAERAEGTYTEVDIPLPLRSGDEILDAITSSMTERTRLLVIDHISSPTAVRFPVERILEKCRESEIDVLIDGAHAPGMIPLDIESLNPAYYAGNLHKWVCAPSGAGFLWVRPDKQTGIHPTTISHFLDKGFAAEFDWQGTRDITPWLCVTDAIEYFAGFGWERVMQHNHDLAVWVQTVLCEMWQVEPSTPPDGSMLGSMVTLPLPRQEQIRTKFASPAFFQARLYDSYRIETPVFDWRGRWWIRPCCQIYNTPDQYLRLASGVLESLA